MTRAIERTSQFKRDFKRELKGQHRLTVAIDLEAVVSLLIEDAELDPTYRDHGLVGEWKGFRDLHLYNDLVLIYSKPDDGLLSLERLGSHSELF